MHKILLVQPNFKIDIGSLQGWDKSIIKEAVNERIQNKTKARKWSH